MVAEKGKGRPSMKWIFLVILYGVSASDPAMTQIEFSSKTACMRAQAHIVQFLLTQKTQAEAKVGSKAPSGGTITHVPYLKGKTFCFSR